MAFMRGGSLPRGTRLNACVSYRMLKLAILSSMRLLKRDCMAEVEFKFGCGIWVCLHAVIAQLGFPGLDSSMSMYMRL